MKNKKKSKKTNLSKWFKGKFDPEWRSPQLLPIPDFLEHFFSLKEKKILAMKFKLDWQPIELLVATGRILDDKLPVKAKIIPQNFSFRVGVIFQIFKGENELYKRISANKDSDIESQIIILRKGESLTVKTSYLDRSNTMEFHF